jgi:sugar phosphate permease
LQNSVEARTAHTPATGVRYAVIAVSVLMAVMLYLDRVCLGEIVKNSGFLAETQLSKDQIGSLLSAFFLTYALFQVPAGWASDRFGARTMLTAYIAIWSLCTMVTGLVGGFAALLAARLAMGIAQAGAYPTSGAVIRRWIPLLARGRASAMVSFGGRCGGTLAPIVTTLLIGQLGGWRAVLVVYGVLGLFVAAAYWYVVRNRPEEHPACNAAEQRLIGTPETASPPKIEEVGALLGACCLSRTMWCNSAGQFLVNIGWVFLITWFPTYLTEVKGVPANTGAAMVTLVLAAGMPGQLLGGYLTDVSVRRLGLRYGRMAPLSFSATCAGVAYLLCGFVDSVWMIVLCCAIVSFMTDLGNPSSWALIQDVGGKNTAAIYGWGNMWGNLGASVSSKMIPWLMAIGQTGGGGHQLMFFVCSLAFFLTALLSFGMNPLVPVVRTPPLEPTPSGNHPSS